VKTWISTKVSGALRGARLFAAPQFLCNLLTGFPFAAEKGLDMKSIATAFAVLAFAFATAGAQTTETVRRRRTDGDA